VLLQPARDVVVVELLAPEHPGERLAEDERGVGAHPGGDDGGVERVGLASTRVEDLGERLAERRRRDAPGRRRRESQAELDGCPRLDRELVVRRRLRPRLRRVHGVPLTVDEVAIERVLHPRTRVRLAEDAEAVRLVLGEQQRGTAVAVEVPVAELGMVGHDDAHAIEARAPAEHRAFDLVAPGPRVPEPERGQDGERGGRRAAVRDRQPDEHVVGRRLRVLDEHVEVPVVGEDARVEQLVLRLVALAAAARLDEGRVRIRRLRVLVEVLHV
jgi:hypothetical protein